VTPDPWTVEVLAALRSHDLLHTADVVSVEQFHQRSSCCVLELSDGRALFVKQARQNAAGAWSADVAGEGHRMRHLAALPGASGLLPEVLVVDEERRMVVTRAVHPAMPLDEARRTSGGTDPLRAAALGRSLAQLHGAAQRPGIDLPEVDHIGPLLRNWSRPTPRMITLFPEAYREVAVLVQRGDFLDRVGELADEWRTDTPVHGDVKSDNVLCEAGAGAPAVRLIDWECAGWGDARWDVGSAIGDYLFTWLRSMRVTADGGLAAWIATASPPMAGIRTELECLLTAYRDGRATPTDDADVATLMRYAGVFLLHRLTMAAMQSAGLGATTLAVLQVSRQLLRSPHTALEVLTS